MASRNREKKIDISAVECAICSEIYRKPKILIMCGHTFCDNCIKNIQGNNSKVECPICRKVTEIPSSGLPPNFVVQDVAEPLRKEEDLRKETTKSVTEFHHKVSSVCQKLNEKLQKWKTISEIFNGMVAKSYEMTETTETMDIDNCHQILKDIKKLTKNVTDIGTEFNHLHETRHLAVLQANNDNIFIGCMNTKLEVDDTNLSTLSVEEGDAVCTSRSSLQENITNGVLIIGGSDGCDALNSLELYNPSNPNKNQFLECNLNDGRWKHFADILSDTLYVVGGSKNLLDTGTLKTMELFDPIRHQWLGYGPERSNVRMFFAGVVIQNQLMVFGGWSSDCSNSCESFDPITQVWSPLPDMVIGRQGHAGVQLNNEVYLIGGFVDEEISSCVSISDPNTFIWTSGPSMRQARASSAVAKFDNGIVVSGGINKANETLKSCEMFDPRQNKWMKIASMKQKREKHVLVNCNGKLLATGGEEEYRESLSCVEEYDPQANQWQFITSLKVKRSGFAAVTVPWK